MDDGAWWWSSPPPEIHPRSQRISRSGGWRRSQKMWIGKSLLICCQLVHLRSLHIHRPNLKSLRKIEKINCAVSRPPPHWSSSAAATNSSSSAATTSYSTLLYLGPRSLTSVCSPIFSIESLIESPSNLVDSLCRYIDRSIDLLGYCCCWWPLNLWMGRFDLQTKGV